MKKKKKHAKPQPHNIADIAEMRSGQQCLLRDVQSIPRVQAPQRTRSHTHTRSTSAQCLFSAGRRSKLWQQHHIQLWCFALMVSVSLLSTGCSVLSNQLAEKVNYANPPKAGSWLQSQRELVACETIPAARHMADFGFFHPQCKQLVDIGPQDYLVESREIVQLAEGPMWLLNVKHRERIYFVPIPWHDWL